MIVIFICLILWRISLIRYVVLWVLPIFFNVFFGLLVFLIPCFMFISAMISWEWLINLSYIPEYFGGMCGMFMIDPTLESNSQPLESNSQPLESIIETTTEVQAAINYYYYNLNGLFLLDQDRSFSFYYVPVKDVKTSDLNSVFTPLRSLMNQPIFDLMQGLTTIDPISPFFSFRTFNPLLYHHLHQFAYVSARISGHLIESHNLLYPGYQLHNLQWLNSASEFGYNSLLVMDCLNQVSSSNALTSDVHALVLPPIIWPYRLPPLDCFNQVDSIKTKLFIDYELLHGICLNIVELTSKLTSSSFFKVYLTDNPGIRTDFHPLYFNSLSARLGYHLNLCVKSLDITIDPYLNAWSSDDFMNLINAKANGSKINLRIFQYLIPSSVV